MGRKIIPDYGNVKNPEIRARYGYLEATISIIGNIGLFILKIILGVFINSIALIADAFHTLSDVGTSGIVIFGFKLSQKPSDKDHPFGHGRIEYIATLIIATLLILTGLGFIQQSIERIINNVTIINQEFAIVIGIIIICSSIIKEIMAQFSFALGRKINSDTLIADAWHHRSDVFASIAVGIGIIASVFGYPILDPIFGVIVSGIIVYVGIDLIRKSSNLLLGVAPDKDILNQIKAIARKTKGVKGIHDILIHDYGTTKVITLHAEVDNHLRLENAHAIADTLEEKIHVDTNCSTIIHLEPKERQTDSINKRKIIEKILKCQKEIISYHNIQIIRTDTQDEIKMHLKVDKKMPVEKTHTLSHKIDSELQQEYGPCQVSIHFEPSNTKK
jgi:cation diffusion facilitator family transporter